MNEWHPRELELARASETGGDRELVEHLRWCPQCRAVAADYGWLDAEIGEALNTGLTEASLPRPDWERVYRRIGLRRRRAASEPLLALAGFAAVACLMLLAPSVLSRDLTPESGLAPSIAAVRVPVSARSQRVERGTRPSLTMTPALSVSSGDRTTSLPFVPPPEPPDPGA